MQLFAGDRVRGEALAAGLPPHEALRLGEHLVRLAPPPRCTIEGGKFMQKSLVGLHVLTNDGGI